MLKSFVYCLLFALIFALSGCNQEIENLSNKGTELVDKGKEIVNGEEVQNVVEQGAEIVDKAQKVDATVNNVVSAVSPKVQVIKNTPLEYKGHSFTYGELFDVALEHPKWELENLDGSKFVLVTGGLKQSILNQLLENEDADGIEKSVTEFVDEFTTVTFVFPFADNKIIPASDVEAYSEVAGTRHPADANSLLVTFNEMYIFTKEAK